MIDYFRDQPPKRESALSSMLPKLMQQQQQQQRQQDMNPDVVLSEVKGSFGADPLNLVETTWDSDRSPSSQRPEEEEEKKSPVQVYDDQK